MSEPKKLYNPRSFKKPTSVARPSKTRDAFSYHPEYNRPLDLRSRSRLRASLRKNGYDPTEPIVGKWDYDIVKCDGSLDLYYYRGQHRDPICKDLDIVYYFMITARSWDDVASDCTTAVRWKYGDFVYTMAERGDPSAKFIRELQSEYNHLNISAAGIGRIANVFGAKASSQQVARGRLYIPVEAQSLVIGALKLLEQILQEKPSLMSMGLISACAELTVCNPKHFDKDRLIDSIKRYPDKVVRGTTRLEAIRSLEDVYNYNRKSPAPIGFLAQQDAKGYRQGLRGEKEQGATLPTESQNSLCPNPKQKSALAIGGV